MNNNTQVLQYINLSKKYINFLFSQQKKYLLIPLILISSIILFYYYYLIEKKYIYSSNININLQTPEITELHYVLSNNFAEVDFNSYFLTTIYRSFSPKESLSDRVLKYNILDFNRLVLETKDLDYILSLKIKNRIFNELLSIDYEKLEKPSDILFSNNKILDVYNHKIIIESYYKLDHEYLLNVMRTFHLNEILFSLKDYFDLYERFLINSVNELEQKLKRVETSIFEPKGIVEYNLMEQYNSSIVVLNRFQNSQIMKILKVSDGDKLNLEGKNLLGLENLFYLSNISVKNDYNISLLTFFIFISILIFFVCLILSYINFLDYNSKN